MLDYLARRLGLSLLMLFGVVLATFLLHGAIPGDPAAALLGQRYSEEAAAELRQAHGLDDPLPIQFGRYLTGIASGDLGRSHMSERPVRAELTRVLPATLELALFALLIASLVGVTLGIVGALRPGSWWDMASLLGALGGVSFPVFWLGLVAIMVVGTNGFFTDWFGFPGLPGRGRFDPGTYKLGQFLERPGTTGFLLWDTLVVGRDLGAFKHVLAHLILPGLVLATVPMAVIARITKTSMGEVLLQDYIRTARAKGLPERVVVLKHALRNAAIPIVTSIGTLLGYLVGGAVLTETVFSWPGMGSYTVEAIRNLDIKPLQAAVLVVAVAFVFLNLLVDLSYAWLDPRVRVGGGE